MPPPQCPECGRFLATAFVEQIATEPAPCPGCGAALSVDPDGARVPAAGEAGPPVPPAAATDPVPPPPAPAAPAVPDDVEPEPETSVRPPDLRPARDPLEGWDESGTLPAPPAATDPAVVATGVGAGLLLGLLLGGREHRGLGALLGALLGAVATRLRG